MYMNLLDYLSCIWINYNVFGLHVSYLDYLYYLWTAYIVTGLNVLCLRVPTMCIRSGTFLLKCRTFSMDVLLEDSLHTYCK